MFGNECLQCADQGFAGSSPQKLQVRRKVYDFHRTLNVKSFVSLKPYGDMPRVMVWDKFAFIGKDKYEMKLERRDH